MVFDIGGILGAIISGVVSDYSKMPALTCTFMLAVAAPLVSFYIEKLFFSHIFKIIIFNFLSQLLIYQFYGSLYLMINIGLLFVVGLFVNGPYALITTSVSAELGKLL